MKKVRWLAAIGIVSAVAALWTYADVSGDSGRDKELKDWRRGDGKIKHPDPKGPFGEELERNRFMDRPAVAYRTPAGDQLFALQIQPKLADAPAQPTDYLVVIDTSASQAAQGNLTAAVQVVDELAKKVGPNDRVAVWTANLKARDVTRGFKSGKELNATVKELVNEVPLGAVNLKRCLSDAVNGFEPQAGRRRAVVYLGDGKSVADPLDADSRAELCDLLIRKQAAFFAVPLGIDLDSQNLHGLVSGTGGKVVRTGPAELAETFVVRLLQDVAEPICYPESFKLPAGVTAALPTRLPPLRRDGSTLVVGKVAPGTTAIDYKLSGEVAGKPVTLDQSVSLPAADPENYFLTGVFDQWKARKDRPALLQGDRALAYAHKQTQLAVEDLIARGEMALEENKLDLAQRIFEQAEGLDPNSARAKGGVVLVEHMRTGKKTRQDMLKELQLNAAKREVVRLTEGGRKIVVLDEGDERPDAEPRPGDDPARRDPLDDVRARRAIAEQQATALVTEAIRQARRRVRTSPDEAYEALKRARDEVQSNADLEQRTVTGLTSRLTREMESINRIRDIVKRDQAEALALRAAADARLEVRNAERIAQDRVRERMRIYHNLMDQAREEEAQKQAILMRDEMVTRGQPVPPAVTAAYQIAQSRYYLKEVQELRRLREDRFLATMLEVERSHVPFPDEPPVVFPDSAIIRRLTRNRFDNWRDWSKYRIERYSVTTFGADRPGDLDRLRRLMNEKFDYGGLDDPKTTLYEALDQLKKATLSKLPGGRDIDFDVNEKAFKYEMLNDVLKTEVASPNAIPRMENVTLATVLKRILAKVPVPSGATYILRPNTIEITTGQFATAEKAVRVYPVADLVVPIPSAYNQQQVGATATILGSLGQMGLAGGIQLGAGGLQLGLALGGALGGGLALGGALGALGGALGALGGGWASAVGWRPVWPAACRPGRSASAACRPAVRPVCSWAASTSRAT
ncbi:MAG: vWA domain-containing protein [Gemmataceae bacterium]